MSTITNVNNPVTGTSGQTKSAAEEADALANVNFDMFLNLMVTQLQNQDPLNPADGTQFTEQLATFSQLEQQVASNQHLEKLANAQSLTSQSLAVNMIGKEVMAFSAVTGRGLSDTPWKKTPPPARWKCSTAPAKW